MATVRATCPTCGDVELTTAGMQVLVCTSHGATAYAFQCLLCGVLVNKYGTPTLPRFFDQLKLVTSVRPCDNRFSALSCNPL